ncbi:MAG: hypothetical protein ACIAQF_00255 [Phycisphaerales bacterium JB065]
MNDTNHIQHPEYEPDRIDILIGRVVDAEASSSDWHELERLADADPNLWGRLAKAQRAHARLTDAVEDELAITELVDLPDPEPIRLPFAERMQRWSGWALAAALCMAWLLTQNANPNGTNQAGFGMNSSGQPVFVQNTTPEDAWSNYVETAQLADTFVSELPPIVVSSTPLDGGGQEVFFVRRSLERVQLTDIAQLRVSQDEQGRPVLISRPTVVEGVPVEPAPTTGTGFSL